MKVIIINQSLIPIADGVGRLSCHLSAVYSWSSLILKRLDISRGEEGNGVDL